MYTLIEIYFLTDSNLILDLDTTRATSSHSDSNY